MAELSPREVRELLQDLIVSKDEEYTWVTGEVDLVTRTGGKSRAAQGR